MSDEEKVSAVMGTTRTIRTLVDGGMTISIDIAPPDMETAFRLFGRPGTNVAMARVTQVAAQSQAQKDTIRTIAEGSHGRHYAVLHRQGWFHNPRVVAAFDAQAVAPAQRPEFIKIKVRDDFGVPSMADLQPDSFREYLDEIGIADTLPKEFGQ
jgi:hypothetical protein